MANSRDIQQGLSEFTHILGLGLIYTGAASLFTMAIVGTISIDLVILAALERQHDGSLFTFMIWRSIFSGPSYDPIPVLIASPITSIIAIALSIALNVPWVGAAIAIGWGVALAILALGYLIDELSQAIKPGPVVPPAAANPQGFFQQAPSQDPPAYTPPSANGASASTTPPPYSEPSSFDAECGSCVFA